MHMVNGAVLEKWTSLADEAVVSHVLDGRVALFELLMRRHHERVSGVVHAIVRDSAEAEDVMQRAFVTAYAHLRRFDGRGSFTRWLTKIAINEALMRAGDARCARRALFDRADAKALRSFASLPGRCDRMVTAVLARIG
jgi:DNA-directed RNA polymerase specialized sigma24 family protein